MRAQDPHTPCRIFGLASNRVQSASAPLPRPSNVIYFPSFEVRFIRAHIRFELGLCPPDRPRGQLVALLEEVLEIFPGRVVDAQLRLERNDVQVGVAQLLLRCGLHRGGDSGAQRGEHALSRAASAVCPSTSFCRAVPRAVALMLMWYWYVSTIIHACTHVHVCHQGSARSAVREPAQGINNRA